MRNWGLIVVLAAGCGEVAPCNLAGVWQTDRGDITFERNGTWHAGGIDGAWTQQGDTLTLSDRSPECASRSGSYTTSFANNCGKVTLTVKSDPCAERAAAIDGLDGYRLSGVLPDMAERIVSLPDLSMKRAPDLRPALNGCNGLLMCYIDCNNGGGAQSCFDDCDAGATQHGVDLLSAYGTCIDTNCFQAIDKDSGMPYCSDATINSPACDACYTRILGTGGACRPAQTACTNDKP